MSKGQCIFFNYQKDNLFQPIFAICTEDFQNQGFDHRTFGQVRGYTENLDIFKYRIRNINVVENRHIFQQGITFMGNETKNKLNDQIKLMVRLKQLEEEKNAVALGSSRDNAGHVKEREDLQRNYETMIS